MKCPHCGNELKPCSLMGGCEDFEYEGDCVYVYWHEECPECGKTLYLRDTYEYATEKTKILKDWA